MTVSADGSYKKFSHFGLPFPSTPSATLSSRTIRETMGIFFKQQVTLRHTLSFLDLKIIFIWLTLCFTSKGIFLNPTEVMDKIPAIVSLLSDVWKVSHTQWGGPIPDTPPTSSSSAPSPLNLSFSSPSPSPSDAIVPIWYDSVDTDGSAVVCIPPDGIQGRGGEGKEVNGESVGALEEKDVRAMLLAYYGEKMLWGSEKVWKRERTSERVIE